MCGIAGIVSTSPTHRASIERMTAALVHRGPDGEGYYRDESIALGQRRLSIIDIEGGRQPIANESETLQLICNGEIYNSPELRRELQARGHRFRTATDVEVILHLYEEYGRQCVRHLRGMFAFAVWDRDRRELLLARDHMGQKPLFYRQDGRGFLFASEIKGLLAAGPLDTAVDLNALWHYISLRYMPDRYSLFEGVRKLPAATTLTLRDGQVHSERYWDLDFTRKIDGDERELTDRLDAELQSTVELQLLSDVPVGAFLSGGIDSSTVTAMMARASGKSFPVFSIGVQDREFDELPFARQVVERYGLEAHEKIVHADLVRLMPRMIYHMDEPSDPFGVGLYLVSELAAQHVKVVLSGDGGDENFAGYDRFAGQRLVDYYCWLPAWIRRELAARVIKLIPESFGYKSLAQKARWVNDMSFFAQGERYAQSLSFLRFTNAAKEDLFTAKARASLGDDDSTAKILEYFDADNATDVVDRMLYTDLMTRMPDHLLALGDRLSMAHSLESRPTLIDYKLVEFAASLPPRFKLRGRDLKYLLKKVAARYLPHELITRRKQGFSFPIGRWLRNDLRGFTRNLFAESRFVDLGIFNRECMTRILDEHLSGEADHNYRLWILINLEYWYRLYFENESIDSLQEVTDRLLAA